MTAATAAATAAARPANGVPARPTAVMLLTMAASVPGSPVAPSADQPSGDILDSQEDPLTMAETAPATAADRILAKLEAVQSQLDRLENRIERLEGLGSKVAVLERQDEIDRHNDGKLETRIALVEQEHRGKVQALESRIQALESDRAERWGMTRAGALGWGALTAAPGLVGMAIALYQAIAR